MSSPVKQGDSPLEMLLEVGHHTAWLKVLKSTGLDILEERGCEWDGTRGYEVAGAIALAFAAGGVGAAAEDRDSADDVVLQGPVLRVLVKVTIEDEHSECLVERVLDGSDVDYPLEVLVVGCQVFE